jgi:YVTN family beta-propeller protein
MPAGVAVAPDGSKVYVTNMDGGTVSVIDTATNKRPTPIDVGTRPFGVAFEPGGKHAFVSNSNFEAPAGSGAYTVSVIDTISDKVVTTLPPVGDVPTGLVATTKNVYVVHLGSDLVSVIDI